MIPNSIGIMKVTLIKKYLGIMLTRETQWLGYSYNLNIFILGATILIQVGPNVALSIGFAILPEGLGPE